MKKLLVTGMLLISVIVLTGCTRKPVDANEGGKLNAFAQCLTDKGVKMYGTERCPHCQNMKKMFGSAFEKISYIDCDKQAMQCQVANIQGYPTWMYKGTPHPGERTLEQLSEISGCSMDLIGQTVVENQDTQSETQPSQPQNTESIQSESVSEMSSEQTTDLPVGSSENEQAENLDTTGNQ